MSIVELLGLLLALYLAWGALYFLWYAAYSHYLARKAPAISFPRDHAEKHIVLMGDSTAVGVGAQHAENTIAGRMAREFPNASISNWSKSACGLHFVARRLEREAAQAHVPVCDLLVLMAGGINVVYVTPLWFVRRNLVRAIRAGKRLSPKVVVIAPNNVGLAPMLFPPFSNLYEHRSAQVDALFKSVCSEDRAACVSLFGAGEDGLTRNKHTRARDKSHPNDAGYGVWWEQIRDTIHAAL